MFWFIVGTVVFSVCFCWAIFTSLDGPRVVYERPQWACLDAAGRVVQSFDTNLEAQSFWADLPDDIVAVKRIR